MPTPSDPGRLSSGKFNRRSVLRKLSGLLTGLSLAPVLTRALADEVARDERTTGEMIANAEWVAGLELSEEQREQTAAAMDRVRASFAALRSKELDVGEAPATTFFAQPPQTPQAPSNQRATASKPTQELLNQQHTDEQLAFLSVAELGALLRAGRVTSMQLTKLYLERLKRYDEKLHCVVTLTESLAMEQAQRADEELKAGRDRGPLHGIPWGAKDLIAYPGYPTTWGAEPFRDQVREEKATVASRLDEAGAVLVAKLTLGALAWGDRWFGGLTRNPWNPEQGSSGSSAGSASATVAGLVGFSLGSETLGSIISPSRRCSVTGLRPTFGRVSRWGCMPLAWTMDKIGPITRSVEDCALVLDAIRGADGKDESAVDRPFHWPGKRTMNDLRIGYVAQGDNSDEREELTILERLGATLVEIELPSDPPPGALHPILNVEAACVFDHLTRAGIEEGLFRWPNAFRQGQFTPAVEYLRAQRMRRRLMQAMEELFATHKIDLYVEGSDLMLTNMTGHPTIALRKSPGKQPTDQPTMFTMTGNLFGETELLTAAAAYEQETGLHRLRPSLEDEESTSN